MKNKEQWTWEYDNDVGPRDDSFRKFWNIYIFFRVIRLKDRDRRAPTIMNYQVDGRIPAG